MEFARDVTDLREALSQLHERPLDAHRFPRALLSPVLELMGFETFVAGVAGNLLAGRRPKPADAARLAEPILEDGRLLGRHARADVREEPMLLEAARRAEILRRRCEAKLRPTPTPIDRGLTWWPGRDGRTNARMRRLLEANPELRSPRRTLDSPEWRELGALVESALIDVGGALVLQPFLAPHGGADASPFDDLTAYECLVNDVRIDDWIENHPDAPNAPLAAGLAAAARLWQRLREEGEAARVILSHDGECCALRFHRLRADESWLTEDLESYPLEAILALDTPPALQS